MNEEQNLKKLEQEAFRELMQDGFTEMMAGLIFIVFPLLIARGSFVPIFVIFYIFFLPQAVFWTREKYVYPRIGYVKPKEDEPFRVTARVIGVVILLIVGGILLFYALAIGLIESDLIYRWIPAAFGLIMWAPSHYLKDKTGQNRNYLFGGLMTITGFAVGLLESIPVDLVTAIFFLSWGVSFLTIGIIRFTLFVRKYPLIDAPEVKDFE